MKSVFKWLGLGLLGLVALAGALFVNAWYFKPLSIEVFFNRTFLRFVLDDPELLSNLRLLESVGIKGHQSKLTDVSPAREDRLFAHTRSELETLHRYDRARLDTGTQLSYDVLDYFLTDAAEGERWRWHNYPVNQLFGVQNQLPTFLLTIHQVSDRRDAEDYVVRLNAVPLKFSQLIEGLKVREQKGVIPPRFVIEKVLAEMREFVAKPADGNDLYVQFADKLGKVGIAEDARGTLLAAAKTAIEQSVYPAYRGLIAYEESLLPKAQGNHGVWALPEGDAFYAYAVRNQTTTRLTPEDVHRTGLAEVARIETEMDAILRGQGLADGSIGARVQQLSKRPEQLYPNDDEGRAQVLRDYQAIIDEIDRGMPAAFNLRPTQGVKVERIPVFKEATSAGAYYNPPAFDGSRPGIFYANLRDLGEVAKFGMRTLAYHEAIPGHHFQIAIAQRIEGVPFFRKVLPFTAYNEGWALYAEQLAWELGYQKQPLDNLGRLQAEMFRSVRLVVDSGLHYQRWTREQAIDYMREKTGMGEKEVTAEIERYLVMPAQALAYKTGMLTILRLRQKAQAELGPSFDLKAFHDVVLGGGALPLPVLERQVDAWIAGRKPA